MSNSIDFLLVISKIKSPIYRRSPQQEDGRGGGSSNKGGQISIEERQNGGQLRGINPVFSWDFEIRNVIKKKIVKTRRRRF